MLSNKHGKRFLNIFYFIDYSRIQEIISFALLDTLHILFCV